VGKARQRVLQPLGAPAQVVTEQLARRWGRCRRPRPCQRRGRIGGQVQQRTEGGHSRHAVGHGVVRPQEQAHPLLWQAGQEPQLPQRPGRVQVSAAQLLARRQQLCLVAGRGQRVDPDVVGQVEGRRVDPQRPAQPTPGPVQALPEARDELQPRLELLTDRLDPDATVAVEQPGAVKDGERADIPWPAEVVPPEGHEVLCGQAF
jgi:hypothetical protein